MKCRYLLACTVVLFCFSIPRGALAEDWPQFLGPDRDGTSAETGLLDKFPVGGPEVLWRVPGGVGMSAIAVADDLAVTTWNGQGKQWLAALQADSGVEVWKTAIGLAYENSMGNGPRSTPTLSGETVFALSGEGNLCAVEKATGTMQWQVVTKTALKASPSEYGMSSSPLVVDGVVVIHVASPQGAIAAFDAKSGELVWTAGRGPAGYSSPTLLELAGKKQLVSVTGDGVVGIDPTTGQTLWNHPFQTDYACNTATPIAVDGGVFISAGENHGCVLLDIANNDGQYVVTERWESTFSKSVMRNEWQTSIVVGDYLYGFDNVGAAGPTTHLSCIEAKTGKPVWQKNRFGKGNMVMADGKFWITTMDGELVLVKVSPDKYEELGRAPLFGKTRQTLSIANHRGYVRDDQDVLCIKLD
jgi:outer membrane protein assembly factor BamB